MNAKKMMVAAITAVIASACVVATDKPFELVGEKGAATVVVPEGAEASTGLAVTELTNYVAKITGRTLAVKTGEGEYHTPTILIGTLNTLKHVPASIAKRLKATDNPEAYCIGAKGEKLWIVGKDEVAELYATYHFLESKLDVRWFKAATKEDPGEYVPKADTLVLAPFAEFREPRFRIRRLDKCGAVNVIAPNAETVAVRNGYQVFPGYGTPVPYDKPDSANCKFYAPRCPHRSQPLGGGHTTFVAPLPAKRFYADHPEYFSLVDGKRVAGEQYCFSNPEVQNRTADHVISLLDKYNGNGQFLFGMVDVTHGWCECDRCRALDPVSNEAKSTPNVSTRFGLAVKAMSSRIWEKWPKADLRLWAYHTYRELPIGVQQDPRMMIQFCDHGRCYGHAFDDPTCKRNADMLALMKGWLKVTPRLYTYEYFTCTHSPYSCHEADEAHDLRLYASLGVVGWKNEAAFSDSYFYPAKPKGQYDERKDRFPSCWQWLYATGKLLWDPDLDENAIIDDAESKYYGTAYPAMKKYHALRRRLWNNNPNCLGYPTGDQRTPVLLNTPGAKEELLGLLDRAAKLAAGESLTLHRIGLDRNWLTRYWIGPNERIRAKAGQTFGAVRTITPIVIDGKGDEGAWAGANYLTAFNGACGTKGALPAELATSVGILYDDEALYFLVRAKEPDWSKFCRSRTGKAWSGDAVELFLFPPAIDNRNYHLAVSPDMLISAETRPGGEVANAFGATAKTSRDKDGWTIEIRLPVAKIHPLKKGETWKINVGLDRRGRFYASDADYFDTVNYRPMSIGSAYLKNGGFSELDKDGNPKDWGLSGKEARVIPSGAGHAVVLKGRLYQTMAHGALGQSDKPRKLKYSFMAKGPGKVGVNFYRYVDTVNRKAKYGYDRKNMPSVNASSFTLTDKMATYSGEYTVPAGEWNSIALHSDDGVTITSITVEPLP